MVESVVDYAAWSKDYRPPSEHVLIDQLSHRGAKVILSATGSDGGWWLVVRGDIPKGTRFLALMQMTDELLGDVRDAPTIPEEPPHG